MTEEQEYLQIPGHISVKEAAARLELTEKRVLQYIKAERLPAHKVRGRYMILIKDFDEFHSKPHGRVRTKPTAWRTYRAGAMVYMLYIEVQANADNGPVLQKKLQSISQEQKYLFPGTMQRFVTTDTSS